MAYRKSSYRKKTYRRRRAYRKVRKSDKYINSVAVMAKEGFWLAKKLARLVNVEKKLHEITLASTTATTSGILWPIAHNTTSFPSNAITQGDGYQNRDGMSVKPMFLHIKGNMYLQPSFDSGARIRFILFRHKNANDQTIFPTSYLNSASVDSFKSWSNRFHFKTLVDRTYTLNGQSQENKGIDIKKKLFGHITYTEDSDLVENGAYYLLVIANAASAVNYNLSARLTFVDN